MEWYRLNLKQKIMDISINDRTVHDTFQITVENALNEMIVKTDGESRLTKFNQVKLLESNVDS